MDTPTVSLRDLLCEKPLSAADHKNIHELLVRAKPRVSRVLLLLLLLDGTRKIKK